jgi:hypothetical protein
VTGGAFANNGLSTVIFSVSTVSTIYATNQTVYSVLL